MICNKCGAEIPDNSEFCGKCGAKLNSEAPEVIMSEGTAAVKKKSKVPLIIIICAAVLAIAAAVFFLFINDSTRINKSAQEKALDRYFEACEELDLKKVDKACYPKGGADRTGSDYYYFSKMLGFTRGIPSLFEYDPINKSAKVTKMFWKSYGLDYPEDDDKYTKLTEQRDVDLSKLYPDFSCSYELEKLESIDDVKVYIINRGSFIAGVDEQQLPIDMKEEIEGSVNADVDEVYAAQIKIKWACGDMEYGNDKSWWDNKDFKDMLSKSLRDNSEFTYSDYDKLIKSYEKQKYNIFIYKSGDDWYVYPEAIKPSQGRYMIEW